MRLSTRLRLSYITVFIIPVLLILILVLGYVNYNLNRLKEMYDLDETSYEMLLNPSSMAGHIANTAVGRIHGIIDDDPDSLKDKSVLDRLNGELKDHFSGLIVRENGKVIYSGVDGKKPALKGVFKDDYEAAYDVFISGPDSYHIQKIDFSFSDGSDGDILIITELDDLLPRTRNFPVRMIIVAVIILSITSAMVLMNLYKSIITPINKLRKAAETMTAGNLNVSVTAESDDEIGELCTSFDEMRLKLKSQIEQNMQYEKDSKELISNISHDLKTPMTSIKGYVEGIMDGVADTPEKQEKYIKTIYNKVNDMDSLIEELFLYAKLDTNSLAYQFARVNVSDYFEDCSDEISMDLESQGIVFGYFNYIDKKTVIIADPEQLKRVINNIIGNSVKYASPDRRPVISLRISEEPEFVKVEIEDNGKGIAKKEIPYIFDRSYRTDASRNSSMGGSGLGLAIAKKIINEHGGKIWAESTEGSGTTICFVIRKYKENINEQNIDN